MRSRGGGGDALLKNFNLTNCEDSILRWPAWGAEGAGGGWGWWQTLPYLAYTDMSR